MTNRPPDTKTTRQTIAYLTPEAVIDPTAIALWVGVEAGARDYDLNVIAFPGGNVRLTPNPEGGRGQANIIYDLVTPSTVSGVLTWAAALRTSTIKAECLTEEQWIALHARYRPLPIVTMSEEVPGYPVAMVENAQGMKDAVAHLIEVHGYQHIAFVRGPEDHPSASARYDAYLETLEKFGIPIRPHLISPPKDWYRMLGAQAVELFLDQHKLQPGKDIEAIATASDVFALTAMRELQRRGLRVPEDIAIVGFNNSPAAQSATPSITSVMVPFYNQAHEAMHMLRQSLDNEPVSQQVFIPSRLVVHQSCGCMDATVTQAGDSAKVTKTTPVEIALQEDRDEVIRAIRQATTLNMENADWAERILDAFSQALETSQPLIFLNTLQEILRPLTLTLQYAVTWQNILSTLQHYVTRCAASDRALVLLGQARTLLAEATPRTQAAQQAKSSNQVRRLHLMSNDLTNAFDISQLVDMLAVELPAMGFPSCYLVLYENPQPYCYPQPAPPQSRLILAYSEDSRLLLPEEGLLFPTHDILPTGMLPSHRRYSMILQPLHFQNTQIGFVLLEVGPRDWPIYDLLRSEISTALQGALLVQQAQRRMLQLETSAEVARSVSGVLDMEALMHRVVNLVQQRFDLYYVGLFLLNEAQAVLEMGSGEPGRRMVAVGFNLPVNGNSAIAQCIANRHSCNAEDSSNIYPQLPETRAELALPLITRGKVIGALSIHFSQPHPPDLAEIAVFETLAGQLANAIENARTYDAIRELSEKLQEDNLRMMAELSVTYRLQQMLLPSEEELRQIKALDVAGFMQSSEEIGGDYYDVLPHDGRVKFCLGDVTGPGLESSVTMLMLQTAVRTLLTGGEQDPLRFLNVLNRLLYDNLHRMRTQHNVSLALLDYEALPHPQVRVSGDHEPIIVVRRTGEVEIKEAQNPCGNLGKSNSLHKSITESAHGLAFSLQPGDGLILYSDGLTKAKNTLGETFGLPRLCAVVSQNWHGSAAEIRAAIAAEIHSFIEQHTIYDDITFLVLKQREGEPAA